jgi:hypothetical protein
MAQIANENKTDHKTRLTNESSSSDSYRKILKGITKLVNTKMTM